MCFTDDNLQMAVFLFLSKTSVFFLPFLNLGSQISCPQNWYTDLKSALDLSALIWDDDKGRNCPSPKNLDCTVNKIFGLLFCDKISTVFPRKLADLRK